MKKILPQKKNEINISLKSIEGKHAITGKKGEFNRKK